MVIRKLASLGAVALCMLMGMAVYGQSKPATKSITVYQDPG